MNPPPYEPVIESELLNIIDLIEQDAESCQLDDQDVEATDAQCRGLLLPIFSMIRNLFVLSRRRAKNEADVLTRSLIEYVVDIELLSRERDKNLNRRFRNYHKLVLYWFRDKIDAPELQVELPRVEEEYRKYVATEFPEIACDVVVQQKTVKLDHLQRNKDVQAATDSIRSALKAGLGRPIDAISGVVADRRIQRGDSEYWRVVDSRLKSSFSKHWSGLSFPDRIRRVRALGAQKIDMRVLEKAFKFLSQKTHPTPYGLPSFDPKGSTTHRTKFYADKAFAGVERNAYLFSWLAIESFCRSLDDDRGRAMLKRFNDLLSYAPKIINFFHKTMRSNANRSSN